MLTFSSLVSDVTANGCSGSGLTSGSTNPGNLTIANIANMVNMENMVNISQAQPIRET